MAANDKMNLPVKTRTIGDYELLELLGDGAQGRVFRARCVADRPSGVQRGQIVALKILSSADEDIHAAERFRQHAELLISLEHRNVVRYVDSFVWQAEWDEAKCLVMEHLEGGTLHDALQKNWRGLPWAEAAPILRQCLAGLIYTTSRGVVHRDLKPSNIFLLRDGAVKLIDFGIARRATGSQTSTHGWRGSFDYMAPDFVEVKDFQGDELSDVFSLGVVMYETLTGRLPFPRLGENAPVGYMERWGGAQRAEPYLAAPALKVFTPAARKLVGRCLERDRALRCPDFALALDALSGVGHRTLQGKDAYEITEYLGKGGFAEVYKARRKADGRMVAVKWLTSETQSRRFLREATLLSGFRHRHIVEYIDFFEVDEGGKQYFLVMEFLEGMPSASLRSRIRESRQGLEPGEVLALFAHYLEACEYFHANGIIHRDLKPSNLYAPEGAPENAKIFDLGVALDLHGTATAGQVPGTLDYMPPEFAFARLCRGTPRTDIYSLGITLYEALTGEYPFERLPKDPIAAVARFRARAMEDKRLQPDYDRAPFIRWPQLKDVAGRALAPDAADRYPSAAKMAEHIRAVSAEIAPLEPQASARQQPQMESHALTSGSQTSLLTAATRLFDRLSAGWTALTDMFLGRRWLRFWWKVRSNPRRLLWAASVPALALALALGVGAARSGRRSRAIYRELAAGTAQLRPEASASYAAELGALLERARSEGGTGPKWDKLRADLDEAARAVPGVFSNEFASCIGSGRIEAAEKTGKEWGLARNARHLPGLSRDQCDALAGYMAERLDARRAVRAIEELNEEIPATFESGAIRDVESLAARVEACGDEGWLRFHPGDRAAFATALGAATNKLASLSLEHARSLGAAGAARFAAEDTNGWQAAVDELEEAGRIAPTLSALARAAYDEELGRLRRLPRPADAGYDRALETLDKVVAGLRSGPPLQTLLSNDGGLADLARIRHDPIFGNETVRGAWTNVVRSCADAMESVVARRTPLNGRGARLAEVESVLEQPNAADVLGRETAARIRGMIGRERKFVLSVDNRSNYPAAISGPSFNQVVVAANGTRTFAMAAPVDAAEIVTVSRAPGKDAPPWQAEVASTGGFATNVVVPPVLVVKEDLAVLAARAEKSVADYVRWRYQVADPEVLTFRRDVEPAPRVILDIPVEAGTMDTNMPRRMPRFACWQAAGPALASGGQAGRNALAADLQRCAARLKAGGETELSVLCEIEGRILIRPDVLPDNYNPDKHKESANVPTLCNWRAHLKYYPEMSCMDTLEEVITAANGGFVMNEYDVRVALYAAYHTWMHARDRDWKYVRLINNVIASLLNGLDRATAADAVAFLAGRAEKTESGRKNPSVCLILALGDLPSLSKDSHLRHDAKKWVDAHAALAEWVRTHKDISPGREFDAVRSAIGRP